LKLRETSFDLVFVYCSSVAQYVEELPALPRVIDFVDVDLEKWVPVRPLSAFPRGFPLPAREPAAHKVRGAPATSFRHCFFICEKERSDFEPLIGRCRTVTPIPNGVDVSLFYPVDDAYDPHSIAFTQALDYFAKVERSFTS